MLLVLLLLSEFLFLTPYVLGHIPPGTELSFLLIIILSALSAIVLPMNIYRINLLKNSKKRIGGSVFGSIIGAIAGSCGCGPIGFSIISTFGSFGAASLGFLNNYENPIRILAIFVLTIALYTTTRSLKFECKINFQ